MSKKVKVGKYEYELSNTKTKKLKTIVNGKTINFGSKMPLMEHYKDRTGLLDKSLNHGDKERRDKYLKRAKGIKDKKGNLTWLNPESPNWHSVRILW